MADLYTKNGRPLKRSGDNIFARSGAQVGRVRGNKVYGPNGRYVGTLVGNRLVYRSTESAGMRSSFMPQRRMGSSSMRAVGSAIMGEEPPIPD
jgi:hypothetical protein